MSASERFTSSVDENVARLAKEHLEAGLKAKFVEYRKLTYAFLGGLGLLIVLLIGSGLISQQSLLVLLHNQIFGFKKNLDLALRNSASVSYYQQFALGTQEDAVEYWNIGFYADKKQRVRLVLDIQHSATGRLHEVTIKLDEVDEPIWQGKKDWNFGRIELTEKLRSDEQISERPENMHFLIFSIDGEGGKTKDRVTVGVLINVLGWETQ